MIKGTKTAQKTAVTRVFSLFKSGKTLTESRNIVAKELKVTSNTLYNWQRRFKMKTPVVTNKIAKVDNTIVSHQSTFDPGVSNMRRQLGGLFTSLITKDGKYTTKEASAISHVSGNILGFARHELEVIKYADKTAKHNITKRLL